MNVSYLHHDFLQQYPSLPRRELTSRLKLILPLHRRQIEEQVETFDEGGGQWGGRHAVDEALRAGGQQVESGEQHPAITHLLRRVDLQEFDDGTAGCVWNEFFFFQF